MRERRGAALVRWCMLALFCLLPFGSAPARGADKADMPGLAIARLALDTERSDAIRQIKRLEYAHAQLLQYGAWDEAASLYSEKAGIISGEERLSGRDAIRQWLIATLGYGDATPHAKSLHVRLMLQPVITLADDGESATGRWTELTMTGRFGERADWAGGTQVNRYVRENGVWKIAAVHRHEQFAGPYEQGWLATGDALPLIPYHFLPSQAGRPVSDIPGGIPIALPASDDEAVDLLSRTEANLAAMTAEQDVLNLRNVYGYYIDRKMWDDAVDLFEPDARFTIAGVGDYRGRAGVRRAVERDGPAGLRYGQVNDRMQLHMIADVAAGADEARVRGLQFGIITPALGEAYWELETVESRFIRRGGTWRIAAMTIYPMMRSDYYQGWARHWTGPQARPDNDIAAYLKQAAMAAPPSDRTAIAARLDAAGLSLARARAYDATENISSALGYYLDDFQWHAFSDSMTVDGWKPRLDGYYVGRDAVYRSMTQAYIPAPSPTSLRTNIRAHIRTQPVIDVAADAKTAKIRTRLFLYTIDTERPGSFHSGMYPNDMAALEEGVWKLSVAGAIDEKYFQSDNYKDGWARPASDGSPRAQSAAAPMGPVSAAGRLGNPIDFPSQVKFASMPTRLAGFGRTSAGWPQIRPMWFAYPNPVSGRIPEHYCPDLRSCEADAARRAAQAADIAR